eukprot:TRINITY_DN33_c0_g1_i1.p1 TRINITY_DN33_c0_g1~~TRINITY_DN33_c0_g1_i1.p1  ORF type:complete len:521 (+),score=148.07 TRINITY_DN33_c0_g1_i1:165-1727(+)
MSSRVPVASLARQKLMVTFQPKEEGQLLMAKGQVNDPFEINSNCETFSNDSYKHEEIVKKLNVILAEMEKHATVLAKDRSRAAQFNQMSRKKLNDLIAEITSTNTSEHTVGLNLLDLSEKTVRSVNCDDLRTAELAKAVLLRDSEIAQLKKESEEHKARTVRLEQDLKTAVQRSSELLKDEYLLKSKLNKMTVEKRELENLLRANVEDFVAKLKENQESQEPKRTFVDCEVQTTEQIQEIPRKEVVSSEIAVQTEEQRVEETRPVIEAPTAQKRKSKTRNEIPKETETKKVIEETPQKFETPTPTPAPTQTPVPKIQPQPEMITPSDEDLAQLAYYFEMGLKSFLVCAQFANIQASQILAGSGVVAFLGLKLAPVSLSGSKLRFLKEQALSYITYLAGVYLSCSFFKRDVVMASSLFSIGAELLSTMNAKLIDSSVPETQRRIIDSTTISFLTAFINSVLYLTETFDLFSKQSLSKLAITSLLGGALATSLPSLKRWGVDSALKNTLLFGVFLTWIYRFY